MAQKITLEKDYAAQPLVQLLTDIQHTSEFRFSYAPADLEDIEVTISQGTYDIDSLCQVALSEHFLDWKLVTDAFVVIKKMKSVHIHLSVLSATNNEPLSFAMVQLTNSHQGAITDDKGQTTIQVPNDPESTLRIAYLGYRTDSIKPLQTGTAITVRLQPETTVLGEIVIEEYLHQGIVMEGTGNSLQISPGEMESLPGMAEPDVLLTVQMIPGINSVNETASEITIRGSTLDHTGFLWNEIPLYDPAHYFGNIAAVIPSATGRVHLHKNFVPVKYGNYLGGLLEMESATPIPNKTTAAVNLNLTHADVYAQGPVSKLGSLLIAGRRSYNDLLLTPSYASISEKVFEGSTTELFQTAVLERDFDYNSQIVFSDWNLVWNGNITDKDSIRISYLSAKDKVHFESVDEDQLNITRQTSNTTQQGLGLKYLLRLRPGFISSLNLARSVYNLDYAEHNIRNFENDISRLESRANDMENLELRWHNQLTINNKGQVELGYQWNQLDAGFNTYSRDHQNGNTISEEQSRESNSGTINTVYVNLRQPFGEKLSAGLGVRTAFNSLDKVKLDPRLFLRYQLNDYITLKTSGAITHQFIQSFQEDRFTLANNIEQFWILAGTGEGRQVMNSKQFNIGWTCSTRGWLVDMEGYRKHITGLNARKINPVLDQFFMASEEVTGIDVLLRKRFRHWRSWVSYAFQHSLAQVPGEGLMDIPSRQNAKHQVQFVNAITIRDFSFSVGYQYRTGLPYAHAEGVEQVTSVEGITYYAVAYQSINQRRLPDYHRLDCSLWYHYRPSGKNFSGQLGISFINLTGHQNYANRTYDVEVVDDQEVALNQTDRYLFGFTPNLSLRLQLF